MENNYDGQGTHLNTNAGEEIVSHIRSHSLNNIPILVFSRSVDQTHFVNKRWLMGSTSKEHIVQGYIDGLLHIDSEPYAWAKYNAI